MKLSDSPLMKRTGVRWQTAFIVLIPVLIYILLAGRYIWLPGIYYDEVIQAIPAIAVLKGGVDGPLIQVEGSVIWLGGHPFPLLVLPYLGSTQAAVLTLAFTVAGISVPVIRWTFIALGAIPLVLIFFFMRRLFGTGTALLSTLLLCMDPTYIFSLRSDNGPTAVMMICSMGTLWLLIAWWQTHKPAYLLTGAFLCGFGLYDKVNFVWFLGALAISVIAIYPHGVWNRVKRLRWHTWLGAMACFCMGASVLLVYIILTRGGPFRGLLHLVSEKTAFGVSNANLLSNLVWRMKSLFGLLSGYEILDFYTSTFNGYHYPYSRGLFPTTALPWLVGLAVLIGSIQAVLRVRWGLDLRKALFLFLLSALVVGASIITPTNLMYHHLLVAYSFLPLLVAHFVMTIPYIVGTWRLGEQQSRLSKSVGWIVGAVVVLIVLTTEFGVVTNYYRVLRETGGIGMWSDAIYELADYLEGDDRTVACMDWGINLNLLALSEGELRTLEPWQEFLYVCDYSPEMEALILHPNQVYVFHAPRYAGVRAITQEDCPRLSFFKTAEAIGSTVTLEKSINQRDGDLLFELYTVSN